MIKIACVEFGNVMGLLPDTKIVGCASAGNAGNVSPPPRVSDPDIHHDICVTHVPWCTPGSLTSGFLWSRWRGKLSRHSRHMSNPQLYVSGKRPMERNMEMQHTGCYNHRTLVELYQWIFYIGPVMRKRFPYHFVIELVFNMPRSIEK